MTSPVQQIRWMIRVDFQQVLEIEAASFRHPWSEEQFWQCLRIRSCVGQVAVAADGVTVLGFVVSDYGTDATQLLDFAVAPEYRRQGVGRAMIERLAAGLSPKKRRRIIANVGERNLAGHLFFRAVGFRAVEILPEWFEDPHETAYRFERWWAANAGPRFGVDDPAAHARR